MTPHELQLHPTKIISNTTPHTKEQHSASKSAIQVELEHRIKCAWATDNARVLVERLTTSLFHASGTWTMKDDMRMKHNTTKDAWDDRSNEEMEEK